MIHEQQHNQLLEYIVSFANQNRDLRIGLDVDCEHVNSLGGLHFNLASTGASTLDLAPREPTLFDLQILRHALGSSGISNQAGLLFKKIDLRCGDTGPGLGEINFITGPDRNEFAISFVDNHNEPDIMSRKANELCLGLNRILYPQRNLLQTIINRLGSFFGLLRTDTPLPVPAPTNLRIVEPEIDEINEILSAVDSLANLPEEKLPEELKLHVKTYKEREESFSDAFVRLEIENALGPELTKEYLCCISYGIPNIPVIIANKPIINTQPLHVYDFSSLQKIATNADGSRNNPMNREKFTWEDVKPAAAFCEGLKALIETYAKDRKIAIISDRAEAANDSNLELTPKNSLFQP